MSVKVLLNAVPGKRPSFFGAGWTSWIKHLLCLRVQRAMMVNLMDDQVGYNQVQVTVCLIVRLDQPHSRVLEIAQGTIWGMCQQGGGEGIAANFSLHKLMLPLLAHLEHEIELSIIHLSDDRFVRENQGCGTAGPSRQSAEHEADHDGILYLHHERMQVNDENTRHTSAPGPSSFEVR